MRTRREPLIALTIAGALLLAACGGGDDDSSDTTSTDESITETTEMADTTAPTDDGGDDPGAADSTETTDGSSAVGGSEDYDPGDIEFRAVNLLDEPVDLYVRTTGLVEAFLVQEGLEPGDVSELYAPPNDGVFLVTEAGATDPTCVVDCDQFIAELGTSFREDEGPVRTAVLYEDQLVGDRTAFEIWEDPDPSFDVGSNAMPAPDPAAGLVVVTAVALTDADFGLEVAFAGVAGCQVNATGGDGILVGGNQTPSFAFDGGAVEVLFHDNQDQECVDPPVGGPFTIEGGPASRTHLILSGSPGDMSGIILPFVGSDSGEGTAGSTAGSTDDGADDGTEDAGGATGLDDLVAAFAAELDVVLGITGDDAQCVSEAFVGGLGEDELRDESGGLRDLDDLPIELQDLFAEVLFESITLCGIDPSTIDG